MADFTSLVFEANDGNNASPNWVSLTGAGKELRWSDVDTQANVASGSWPYTTRPVAGTAGLNYAYAFTSDSVGQGIDSGAASTPAAFTRATYLQTRWNWDATGSMASAPIITAYPSNAHGAVTRGDGSLLGGHATDTTGGGAVRSYLKGLAYGITASQQTPAAQPSADPVVTDGSTGSVATSTGAWSAVQGLQGDNDYITCGDIPPVTTARIWYMMLRLFMGANINTGVHTPVLSLKYTYI